MQKDGRVEALRAVWNVSQLIAGGNETQRALKPLGRVCHHTIAIAAATTTQAVLRSKAFKTAVPHTFPGLLPRAVSVLSISIFARPSAD